MIKEIDNPINKKDLIENYTKILKLMTPVLPHFASECLEQLNCQNKSVWPEIDPKFISVEKSNIVIQINGKKRGILNFESDTNEDLIIKKIKENGSIKKYLINKKILKKIYIKNKLMNLIIE